MKYSRLAATIPHHSLAAFFHLDHSHKATIQNGSLEKDDNPPRHEFIERLAPGKHKLRVPLFEQWVQKFYLDYL